MIVGPDLTNFEAQRGRKLQHVGYFIWGLFAYASARHDSFFDFGVSFIGVNNAPYSTKVFF